MNRLHKVTIAASLLTGIWLAGAQAGDTKEANCSPPPGPGFGGPGFGGPRHPPLSLLESDLNKDGRITRTEIDQSIKTRFDTADADHNGTLDAKEFETARPKPPTDMPKPPEGAPPPSGPFGNPEQMFKRVDWNADGKLSPDEFAAPVRTMASRIDRDADGVITQDELDAPPHGPGRGGPPPR